MKPEIDLSVLAREIIDSSQYMTLATANAAGRPWASPVWFAHEAYTEFVWVSKPEARHSQNLAARPEAGVVIFDSSVPIGGGRAVYLEAKAAPLQEDEAGHYIDVFSHRSQELGGPAWGVEEISPPAPLRLYRASASAHYVLGKTDERIAVRLG